MLEAGVAMRGRKPLIRATAAAVAATCWPLAFAHPAGAGEGDDKSASKSWAYTRGPEPGFPGVSCSLRAGAELHGFNGFAFASVEDGCTAAAISVTIRYTDRFGNPAKVQALGVDPGPDAQVVAVADDVEGDMVAEVAFDVDIGPGFDSSRTLTPK